MTWYLVKAERMTEPSAVYVYNLGDEGRNLTHIRGDDEGGLTIHLTKPGPLEGETLAILDLPPIREGA